MSAGLAISRQSAAYHEAGHATVARVLGIEVQLATIKRGPGGSRGHVEHSRLADDAGPVAVEHHAMLSVAGCMADRRYRGAAEADLDRYEGALEDLNHAWNLIESTMGQDVDEALLDARMNALDLRVDRLLDQHWGAVERVAACLLERETLTGAELDELIWQPPTTDAPHK